VRLNLAVLYRETRRAAESIPHLEYLLRQNPDNPLILNELALAHRRLGNLDDALVVAEKAYKRLPAPAIADTLGVILLERGQTKRALELLGQAAAAAPRVVEYRLNHARALLQARDHARARQELQAVLDLPASSHDKAVARRLLATLP